MGICVSQDGARSVKIDQLNKKDNKRDQLRNHILLLGPGESGKSTFLKQLIAVFGAGHKAPEFKPVIYRNVVRSIRILTAGSRKWSINDIRYAMSKEIIQLADMMDQPNVSRWLADIKIRNVKKEDRFVWNSQAAETIQQIWQDEGIQACYYERSRLQLLDSSKYFFDKVLEIGTPGYSPSIHDCVRARVRSTGVQRANLALDGRDYLVADVGGQRSERKKWLHLFEHCSTVIYFAALSEFDQFLFEEGTVNRMDEALSLFEDVLNTHWFMRTPIVLFLNKKDLFIEKLRRVQVSDWCTEYKGDNSYDDVSVFFKKQFEKRNSYENRKIYTHFTCVIDDSAYDLFRSVAGIVLMESIVYESDEIM